MYGFQIRRYALGGLGLGLVLLTSVLVTAHAQHPPNPLVGSWRFETTFVQRPDGSRVDLFGPQPNGLLLFTADGHFALINTRPDRPKFVSHNRLTGTPAENQATTQGVVAYFGTYTVDPAGRTFTIHIDGSSYPNDEGTEQTRPFTLVGNELQFVNPAPTVGGSGVHVTVRRLS